MSPEISVIVPIYNTEKYLEECLNSILSQSMKDIEVICIDDGSTDASAQLCNRFKETDNRITIIYQENKGLSIARNKGIECARGQYVLFVDSDDWIDSSLCKKVYDKAIETNADMTLFFYQEELLNGYNRPKRMNEINDLSYTECDDKLLIAFNSGPMVWKFLWKTQFIRENRLYFTENILYEDFEYTSKGALLSNKIAIVSQYYYHYRQRKSSISFDPNYERKIGDCMVSMDKAILFAKTMLVPQNCICFLIGRKYRMIYTLFQRVGIRGYPYFRHIISQNCRKEEKDIVLHSLPDSDKLVVRKIRAVIGTPKEKIIDSFHSILDVLIQSLKVQKSDRKFYN